MIGQTPLSTPVQCQLSGTADAADEQSLSKDGIACPHEQRFKFAPSVLTEIIQKSHNLFRYFMDFLFVYVFQSQSNEKRIEN